jgi:hypothetical protein
MTELHTSRAVIASAHIARCLTRVLLRDWSEVAIPLVMAHHSAQQRAQKARHIRCEHCRHLIPHAWPRQRYCGPRCADAARNARRRAASALQDRARAASVARRQGRRP